MSSAIRNGKHRTGEIYLVRFHPAAGEELKRYRPAVIISDRVNSTDSRFSLIAPLTTGRITNPKYEMSVKRRGDLAKDSTLLLWYLRTVDVGRVERIIATLTGREVTLMKRMLKRLLDL